MRRNRGKNATGSHFLRNRKCSTCSGQPSMAKGNKAEENHVSRTSGSDPGRAQMGEKVTCQQHRGQPMRQSFRAIVGTVWQPGVSLCVNIKAASPRVNVTASGWTPHLTAARRRASSSLRPQTQISCQTDGRTDRRGVRRAATLNTDPSERLLRILHLYGCH